MSEHRRVQLRAFRGRRPLTGVAAAAAVGTALALPGASHAAAAGAGTTSMAPAVDGASSGGQVIVVLKDQHANLNLRTQASQRKAAAQSTQAPVVTDITSHGGTDVSRLTAPDAVAARLSAAEVSRLRADPSVAEIVPDVRVPVMAQDQGQAPAVPAAPAAARGAGTPARSAAKPASAPAKAAAGQPSSCPFNPAGPGKPLVEPEALSDIHAASGNPNAPDMANTIATGKGVVVAIAGMNQLAGNPNFTRPDGSHVVIDAPDYTADHANDESYGDASSVAAQGTVVYQYAKALPYSDVPPGCSFVIRGDAPGASLVDSSQIDTPPSPNDTQNATEMESQLATGIDNAVTTEHADIISESYGGAEARVPTVVHAANDAAVAAGVTVVVSSGDSGDSGTMNPISADPAVIAAGAVDNFRLVAMAHDYGGYLSNNMAAISSGGTAPTNKVVNLVAPGYFGEAACADGSGGCPPTYPTESFRGTSEAAPLIAGAAADVIQAYRDTHSGASPTPAMIKDILASTATDISSPADQQGGGLLNVYAAVRAAQQMPGSTLASGHGAGGAAGLVASPSQLGVAADGGTVSDQSVSLYNTGSAPAAVTGTYRWTGPERQIGRTVTENISAPPAGQPIPSEGARAGAPVTFTVPRGLDRLDADMIWPDPTNNNIICFALFDPQGRLAQLSYDDGNPSTTGGTGSIPDIQHAEVTSPEPGQWTAKILWSGKDVDLALPPATPGTYTGSMSFKVSGQDYLSAPASAPVVIPAHASAQVPLHVAMPTAPGDYPESVQFSMPNGTTASVPVARRTLIPENGGSFRTLITSTVGRAVGQLSTYEINVPAGRSALTATFSTADTSPDNKYTYYLVSPDGTVAATGSTPSAGASPGTVQLSAASPAAGTWQIDVELNLTTSGKEFTQTVNGTVQDP